MRLLHYISAVDFRHGGPPRAVVDQVATMHARGHSVTLATMDARDVPEEWKRAIDAEGHPRVVDLSASRARFGRLDRTGCRRLGEVVGDVDVVHLHGVWDPSNAQFAKACVRSGTPYVVSLRGMLDDWSMAQKGLKKRCYLALGGRGVLESACRVHCTADAELEQSRKWFPRGRGIVIPNLMDLSPFESVPDPAPARREWPEIASGDLCVLFLSRIQYKKGIEHLLDGLAILRERGRGVRLVVAGSGDRGYTEAMQRRAVDLGLEDVVTWTGHVGGDLKWSLYSACDVFALPTSQENFGFVFFESLAAGTPVITSDLVDTRGEIERSGGGVVVPQSATAFAEAIEGFVTGERDRRAMGEAGRRWTLENLDTGRVAGRFEALYEECIGTRGST